jgi:hypothetical protein
MSETNNNQNLEFVGEMIRPADNLDPYDTLCPLWNRKEQLSETEKALVYVIGVLTTKIINMEKQITNSKN